MLSNSGNSRTRYEDVFRAIGNYLDNSKFIEIMLVETPQGFLVKGRAHDSGGRFERMNRAPQTFLLSDEDIDTLIEDAHGRRGRR